MIVRRRYSAGKYELIKRMVPIKDAVEVLAGTTIDKRGFCRCPFHNEATPSFRIYPDTNSFYCFGCQAAGDVVKFAELATHKSPSEAANLLCELFHIGGQETSRAAQDALRKAQRRRNAAQEYEATLEVVSTRVRSIRQELDSAKAAFKAHGEPIEDGGNIGRLMGQLEQAEFEYWQIVEQGHLQKTKTIT